MDLFSGRTHAVNILLWVLQILAALFYGAAGVMKVFRFDKIALGIIELIAVAGLIVPAALSWHPELTVVAAALLAMESFVFIWLYVKYNELPPIVTNVALGLLLAFIAYGRLVLKPPGG